MERRGAGRYTCEHPCFVVKVDSWEEDDVPVEGRKIDRNLEAITLSQQWGKAGQVDSVIAAAGSEHRQGKTEDSLDVD